MSARFFRSLNPSCGAAAVVLAGLTISSCAPMYSSPQQVEASNPTVTYTYRSDNELIEANRNAMTFCNRYQATPQTTSITDTPDGRKNVVFECVPTSSSAYTSTTSTNLTHSYRTDQELLEASRRAQVYCMNNGSQQAVSSITTNVDGTRTVTFRCSP